MRSGVVLGGRGAQGRRKDSVGGLRNKDTAFEVRYEGSVQLCWNQSCTSVVHTTYDGVLSLCSVVMRQRLGGDLRRF